MPITKTSQMAKRNAPPPAQINMISRGAVLEGTLRAESDVRISGRIVGSLRVQGRAIITEEGFVDGELIAQSADIAGGLEGLIRVTERLMLRTSARVDADIRAARLIMEDGAVCNGRFRMTTASAPDEEGAILSIESEDLSWDESWVPRLKGPLPGTDEETDDDLFDGLSGPSTPRRFPSPPHDGEFDEDTLVSVDAEEETGEPNAKASDETIPSPLEAETAETKEGDTA